VAHAEREHGDSKYSPMRLINLMFDLVTCMTTTPLRLLSIVGFAMAGLGALFAIALIVLRLAFGAGWAGDGTFVLFAVLFVFTGGQFIGMGLWVNTWDACTATCAPARASSLKRCCAASRPPRHLRSPLTALLPIPLPIRFSHECKNCCLRLPRYWLRRH
jgi:hypothetical protein